uniref:Uncharacterized protein n=1 Tax=Rhizophagus irregularis (strain DAOM 181602 / DAOM 197198 / MUCL 43194) TaxID=747089 RepID=U9U0F7_RHIID
MNEIGFTFLNFGCRQIANLIIMKILSLERIQRSTCQSDYTGVTTMTKIEIITKKNFQTPNHDIRQNFPTVFGISVVNKMPNGSLRTSFFLFFLGAVVLDFMDIPHVKLRHYGTCRNLKIIY